MSETQLSRVDNFEISRPHYGSVKFPGLTDLRSLSLDDIVAFDQGSLTLYPDMEKPPTGTELNKEAVVTLYVRPPPTNVKRRSEDVLRARLVKISAEFGGQFISYDNGEWIFRVPHFNGASESEGEPVVGG